MIRLMDQPLDMLQKDPYWNDELVKVTSCLVERQFPEKYREQKTREDLVKKLAEIQAQIEEVDAKMTKLKKPFEKIQEKKAELGNQLSEIEKNKLQNEADLKRLQEEELQEIDLFKGFEDNKIQLKHTLEEFLRELGD
ncbi:hypothetical protein PIB30_060738 [Stylosanthes scabra]|uniref:Uncharacterized protein n=1 Tax=Stylosanthes scabra TaxID=79078 RepID=A0ABU6RKY5_9FABA|nr:hypothetical protein [Stylosanthes scabra]